MKNPEQQARQTIDAALAACGWVVQDYEQMNLAAAQGIAVREFPLASGFGRADYALYVDEELVGAVEAKKEGVSFASFETQTQKYSDGVPDELEAPIRPLPFLYQSTGIETQAEVPGVPVIRMGNIFDGQLDLSRLKFLPPEHDEFPALLLRTGDVLFNRTNSAELVGKAAVYQGSPNPCTFASYLIRIRMADGCAPDYVSYCLNSPLGRNWINSVVSQQVGQANVNGSKLRAFGVPLPPTGEQARILAAVAHRFSNIDALLKAVEIDLVRSGRLRQALLQSAFDGKLCAPAQSRPTQGGPPQSAKPHVGHALPSESAGSQV